MNGFDKGDGSCARSVLFLDVDGVLNSKKSRKMFFCEDSGSMLMDDSPHDDMLKNLQSLVDQTQCKIVVSSTWRLADHKLRQLERRLSEFGMVVKDKTPDLSGRGTGDRVDEILLWLEMRAAVGQRVEAWVVLDDMDLIRQNDLLEADRFVRTDDGVGLTSENVEEALCKLQAQRRRAEEAENGEDEDEE
eukprot:TRINITY_DN6031_c0_g1_i3.p1 TRINITY_DN6031_c0_g1~~TRINITY_DN6031_c0_g1_i3.p1  ORF type:complete len:213 (+),score=64.15 TRINITY_DN6031_c0_g1_i3:70-639(+)